MKHKKIMAFVLVFMMMFSTMVSSAASDPAVTIISPVVESVVNSDSLLVSIKITQPETIRVSVYEEMQMNGEELVSVDVSSVEAAPAAADAAAVPAADTTAAAVPAVAAETTAEPVNATASGVTTSFVSQEVMAPETFTCTNTLSFFTKQINNVTPGLYKVKVETISEAGEVLYSTDTLVVVKGVTCEEEKTDLFETKQSGISQFLQNLLKNIFG